MRRLIKTALISSLTLFSACSWWTEDKYYSSGQQAAKSQKWEEAVEDYEKSIKVSPESEDALKASRDGARIALVHTKDATRLVTFLKHIILYSKSEEERISSQRLLAETYFEKLNDYKNAAIELNKALEYYKAGKESSQLRLMLARAYFFQNEFFQARTEVDTSLKDETDPEVVFKALLLKANIYFNEKNLDEAINMYQRLETEFPVKAKSEQVALNLAVCFEEKEDFQKAIEVLEKMRIGYSMPEMIDLKISRLKARLEQQPGAKGLKK
jgi:tetratricopeptide (TPR) repeat protein